MTTIAKKSLFIAALLSLSACAQQQIRAVRHEIKALNGQMDRLDRQTEALARQNVLNADSSQGAYLLPDARTPVLLKSLMGTLKLSLKDMKQVNHTFFATLAVSSSGTPLPAFKGKVVSGQLQGAPGNYQEINVETCSFSTPDRLVTSDVVTIPLRFSVTTTIPPDFIRIHGLQPLDPNRQPSPIYPFRNKQPCVPGASIGGADTISNPTDRVMRPNSGP